MELENNRLEVLPETLGDLPNLVKLDISTNSLRFLPASLVGNNKGSHNRKSQRTFRLSLTLFWHHHQEKVAVKSAPVLAHILIWWKKTSVLLRTASQGNYKKIQRIDVANNLLARVPPSMGHLKLLKEFNLRYNSLDDRWGVPEGGMIACVASSCTACIST